MDEQQNKNEIIEYMNLHGVQDKDLNSGRKVLEKRDIRISKKGKNYRKTVDLHGKHAEEAGRILRHAIHNSRNDGVKSLLVIHGKGHHSDPMDGPVLKSVVRNILNGDLSNYVKEFRDAPSNDGGSGATVVKLN